MKVYGYGQGRNGAFVAATQGMRALLASRPREKVGAQPTQPTQAERKAAENKLIRNRLDGIGKGKYPLPPKPLELKK